MHLKVPFTALASPLSPYDLVPYPATSHLVQLPESAGQPLEMGGEEGGEKSEGEGEGRREGGLCL